MTETVLMGSFGENLRREREMRDVSLEEISAATKISVRFLKSIENEDFSKLPGGLFNRSFVRAYARYLGLDEESLLAEYQLAAKAKGEVDVTRLSFPVSHATRPRSNRSTWVGIVAAAVLLVAGYGLWRYSRSPASPGAVETKQLRVTGKPAAQNGTSSPAPTAPFHAAPAGHPAPAATGLQAGQKPFAQPPGSQAASSQDANVLFLQVATTEKSWVAIDADGKTIMQGIMSPNQVKTFRAQQFFDVMTGNARGVVLTLNGHTLKPLGREGEVKSVHLSWDTVKNLKSP